MNTYEHLSTALLLALLACAAGGTPAAAGERARAPADSLHSVRIVSPGAGDVAYGPVPLRAEARAGGGAVVLRVELFADGILLSRDRFAPYAVRWDAGTSMASHVLRAVATFSDGRTAEDLITTRGLSLTEHEIVEGTPIEHVELLAAVTNEAGETVQGLTKDDFEIRDGATPVKITGFDTLEDREDVPLSLVILVDKSGSMGESMKTWHDACLELLHSLRPIDQIRVTAFAGETRILQDFTRDYASLAASLDDIGLASGETGLFRALLETVRDLQGLPGRKAIIALTDGLDTDFTSPSGPITVSMFAILRVTARLASRAGVSLFVILPRPSGRGYLAVQDLALQTGGGYMYPTDDLGALMSRLGRRLLGSYLLAYDVDRPADPDRRRKLDVELKGSRARGLTLHTAMGVYGRIDPMEALEDELDSGSSYQRVRALRELSRLPGDEIAPRLVAALGDASPAVRVAALESLASRRDPGTLPRIEDRFHDADVKVRRAALDAAAAYGEAALPGLLDESQRRGGEGRAALRVLGTIGSPSALPRLAEAMGGDDCETRAAAADGVGNLLAAAGSGFGAGEPEEGTWTARALELLRPALTDPCRPVAEASAIALGRLGRLEADPTLAAAARASEPSPRLAEVLSVLRSSPDPEIVAVVERHLSDPEPVRSEARRTVAFLYGEAVRSGEGIGREEALERLVALGGEEAHAVLSGILEAMEPAAGEDAWIRKLRAALEGVETGKVRGTTPTERR